MARNQPDANCSSAGKKQTSRTNERGRRLKQGWDWHEISPGKGYGQRRTLGRAGLSRIHDVIVASMLVGRDHLSLEEDDKGHECQQLNVIRRGLARDRRPSPLHA